jgi:signal peptidase II
MLKWLWLSGLIIVLDQYTKWLAETHLTQYQPEALTSWFNLTLMYNTGAAFSFLANAGGWQRWLLLGLALAVSVVILVLLARVPRGQNGLAVAFALILGGAIGNIIDRALYGHVIDFIDLHHSAFSGWLGFSANGHWPAFNIADAAIFTGALMLLLDSFRPAAQTAES